MEWSTDTPSQCNLHFDEKLILLHIAFWKPFGNSKCDCYPTEIPNIFEENPKDFWPSSQKVNFERKIQVHDNSLFSAFNGTPSHLKG